MLDRYIPIYENGIPTSTIAMSDLPSCDEGRYHPDSIVRFERRVAVRNEIILDPEYGWSRLAAISKANTTRRLVVIYEKPCNGRAVPVDQTLAMSDATDFILRPEYSHPILMADLAPHPNCDLAEIDYFTYREPNDIESYLHRDGTWNNRNGSFACDPQLVPHFCARAKMPADASDQAADQPALKPARASQLAHQKKVANQIALADAYKSVAKKMLAEAKEGVSAKHTGLSSRATSQCINRHSSTIRVLSELVKRVAKAVQS